MFQTTLRQSFSMTGIGVHSGEDCGIVVRPADENVGVVFIDPITKNSVVANYQNVVNTAMCTELSANGISVSTVEHILSAFYGMGITNAVVEFTGAEVPILDGSAAEFVKNITDVGISPQYAPAKVLQIMRSVRVDDGEKWVTLSPANEFSLRIECNFIKKGLHTKLFCLNSVEKEYIKEIASARTFGFFEDADFLKQHNLAKGASLDNTVVFDKYGIPINKEGLRIDNEPIRHKALDAIGDLSTSGYRILGQYAAYCPSHKLNNSILRVLFSDARNYKIL